MRAMTFNILFGMNGRNLMINVFSHMCIHGARSLLPNKFGKIIAPKWSKWRSKNLGRVIKIIMEENPDVVCLNEVLMGMHKEELEGRLSELGYNTFSWGTSNHYEPPIDISTFVATKKKGKVIFPGVTFVPEMGGGGGCSSIIFAKEKIIIVGLHTSSMKVNQRKKQFSDLRNFLKKYEDYNILVMGDLNVNYDELKKECLSLVEDYNLESFERGATCPYYYVPGVKKKRLDHILHNPKRIKVLNEKLIKTYSDHKVVIQDLELLK